MYVSIFFYYYFLFYARLLYILVIFTAFVRNIFYNQVCLPRAHKYSHQTKIVLIRTVFRIEFQLVLEADSQRRSCVCVCVCACFYFFELDECKKQSQQHSVHITRMRRLDDTPGANDNNHYAHRGAEGSRRLCYTTLFLRERPLDVFEARVYYYYYFFL